MILALFILGCLFTFSVFCGLAILGYRSRAHSAEARANRAEGALGELQIRVEQFRELAREAIRAAAGKAGLKPDEVLPPPDLHFKIKADATDALKQIDEARDSIDPDWRLKTDSNYIPQSVAFCPSCNVSVRHDPNDYPVPCPACQTLIDPVLDNPPELN